MQRELSSFKLWLPDIVAEDPAAKTPSISKIVNRHLHRIKQWLMGQRRGQLLLLLLVVTALLALGMLAQVALVISQDPEQAKHADKYAVYIDGGSSGTRVRVFRYRPARWPSYVALALPEPSSAVEPGLSAYADSPARAADSLEPLLDFAYQHVPPKQRSVTPVKLLATAGLRLVSEAQQEAVLAACGGRLAASHFRFESGWATVIGGEMEGLYGWAAVNYITGALQEAAGHAHHSRKEVLDPSQLFTGLLEMGGASMQVTFLPPAADKAPAKHGAQLHLPGVPSRLYAHSYLGLGMDSALARAIELVVEHARPGRGLAGAGATTSVPDPCLPIGYISDDGRHGNASFAQCLAVVQQIMPEHSCSKPGSGGGSSGRGRGDGDGAVRGGRTLAAASSSVGRHNDDKEAVAVTAAESYSNDQRNKHDVVAPDDSGSSSSGSGGGRAGGGGGCTLQGSYVPALAGRFVAVENLAWTARALGLPTSATLRQLREYGVRYCSRHWSSLHAEFSGHIPDQFLVRYCFGAAYILALLQAMGFGMDDTRLTWTNTVREAGSGAEVGLNWVLGAAVVDAMNVGGGGGGGSEGGGVGGGSQSFWLHEAATVRAASAALFFPLAALAVLAVVLAAALVLRTRGGSGGNGGSKASVRTQTASVLSTAAAAAAAAGLGGSSGTLTPASGRRREDAARTGGGSPSSGLGEAAWSPAALIATAAALARQSFVADSPDLAGQEPGLATAEAQWNGVTGPSGHEARASQSQQASRTSFSDGLLQQQQDGGGAVGFLSSRVSVLRAQTGGGTTTMRRNPSFTCVLIPDGGQGAGQGATQGGGNGRT